MCKNIRHFLIVQHGAQRSSLNFTRHHGI